MLGSIVATAVGCGGDVLDTGDQKSELVTAHCNGEAPSFVRGLNPRVALDSLSFYSGATPHLCLAPDYGLMESNGSVCENAADRDSCLSEVERLRAGSVDWGKYENFWEASFGLLVATGTEPSIAQIGGPVDELSGVACGSAARGGAQWGTLIGGAEGPGTAGPSLEPSVSAEATTIRDVETLKLLLGTIDTANEALLMFWAHNHDPSCTLSKDGDDFVASSTLQISDCPFTYQDYEVRITPEGVFSQVEIGEPHETGGCAGRRPEGLACGDRSASGSPTAAWLERIARLETAAAAAFGYLMRDLKRLGAPAELVARAERAALDEVRHAREVTELALRHGARVREVVVEPQHERSLLSLAVENAVEGCVRECWGALVAHHQARTASDEAGRRMWSRIAHDESEHATLSHDLAVWFAERLTAEERTRVERAHAQAIVELRREVARMDVAPPELGLPHPETALVLLDELTRRVFSARAA